jgi:serine/threonine protein kinase
MALVLEQFVRNLRESRLLSPEEATSLEKAISASKTPRTAEDVARLLVQNGKLTQFQAAAIGQGRQQSLILGEYILMDVLGKGGMGVVFRARHRLMDRVVALKTLATAKIKPDSIQRFQREVKAAARLSHPNIVTAFDAGEHHGTHYLVTEYVVGRDLSAIVKEKGPLSLRQAIDYARQAACGLDFAHNHGVVHRDVKPSNLLLDRQGVVKILDMGLARLSENLVDNPEAAELTGTGQILGTVDYMSPEQAVDVRSADHLSDIYSLGCTLYYFLTRRPVYPGENIVQRILAHRDNPVPSVMESRPDCPPALDATFRRMLAKRPQDRPQSMAEIINELDHCMASPGDAPPPVGAPPRSMPSPSSWLEDLVSDAAPATDDSQIHEATVAGAAEDVLHSPPQGPSAGGSVARHSGITRRMARKKTGSSARGGKWWPIVAGLAAVALAAAGGIYSWITYGRGDSPAETDLAAEGPKNSAATDRGDAMSANSAKPVGNPRTAWEIAWDDAKARVDRLVAKHSYEKAIKEYSTLAGRFKDAQAQKRLNDAIHTIEAEADRAYAGVEKVARRHLEQRQFAKARTALQTALANYGSVPPASNRAKKLLEQIDAAEKKAAPAPEKRAQGNPPPAPPVIPPELLKKRQQDAAFADAMEVVEGRAAEWDFSEASRLAGDIRFDVPELTARAVRRRDEIKRMADLKDRMISAISQASPPLQKFDLGLQGINGLITKADATGITATFDSGKQETIEWKDVGPKALNNLLGRVVRQQDAGDWLAAGLLALQLHDAPAAERDFDKARSLGADTAPYRALLAAAEFAAIRDLLAKRMYAQGDARLAALAEKYGKLPWFADNKLALDAAAKEAKRGLREKDAEDLYTKAAGLYLEGRVPELKPVIDRFQSQYADSGVAADQSRKPSLAEMAKAVADVGPLLRVRKDGQGDARSIREAVNKAARNAIIQIEESGPWSEQIVIPAEKDNLTICGKKGLLPVLTTAGAKDSYGENFDVRAPRLSLERLVIVHDSSGGKVGEAITAEPTSLTARGVVVYGHSRVAKLEARQSVFAAGVHSQQTIDAKDSAFFAIVGSKSAWTFQNVLVWGIANSGPDSRLNHCTITGRLHLSGKIFDSIVSSIAAESEGQTIEHCDVYGEEPYVQKAVAGKGCFTKKPLFVDLKGLDFKLRPLSPCRSAASDGSDLGFAPTPELQSLIRVGADLRKSHGE